MPAIRGCGFDDNGNFWVEPTWAPEGTRVYLTASEMNTIGASAVPRAVATQNPAPDTKPVQASAVVNPTGAAIAKAQTLQTRLDGLMDVKGEFHQGQVVVTVDKASQAFGLTDAVLE